MQNIINQKLTQYRARMEEIAKDLHDLTVNIGAEDLALTLSDLRNRLHEPFMFVIVGEVKAGKSSFINALLSTGKEICKVAPQPMTDTVQQILYGEEESTVTVNPYLKKIFQPVEILKEIAIVDTPGTNTIIEHHQDITERFVPASDLIVFVFEAKNPYRQSAWEFFDFIHSDWRRKVIFVLQQKDLMDPADLAINEKGLREHAEKKGVDAPKIFSVSAKQELEGQEAISGFKEVRKFIRENITGGKAPALKLLNTVNTAESITEKIRQGLDLRSRQFEADKEFRADIKETLETHEKISKKQVDVLIENLLAGYDRITYSKQQELAGELSVFGLLKRSLASIFNKEASIKNWSERFATHLERDLQQELQQKLQASIGDLAESIQQMAKIIDLKIQNSQTILKNNHEIFSDIAERRTNVLRDLQDAFSKFLQKPENFADKELFPGTEALSPNLLTGSGLAVIGTVLMAVTNGMVFDITGGVLTTIGLLFAGISTSVKKRQILKGFENEVQNGRQQIEQEVTEKLKTYITHIKERLERNFEGFDQMLEQEERQIETLEAAFAAIGKRLNDIKSELAAD